MEKYLIIKKVSSTIGNGYLIHAELDTASETFRFRELAYYGYSKKESISKYRNEISARGKHFVIIDL